MFRSAILVFVWALAAILGVGSPASAAQTYDTSMDPFLRPEGRPLGDTFPFCYKGTWHLFYVAGDGSCPGHLASQDLVKWEQRPAPIQEGVATGCVVEKDGKFYLFYSSTHHEINLATSTNLDDWIKHTSNPVLRTDAKPPYSAHCHDPSLFFNEQEKCWWMPFGTLLATKPVGYNGAVGLAKSADLLHWELCPPLWTPDSEPCADCPQVLQQGNRWYLAYLPIGTRYRVADSPAGPWRRPPIRDLGTPMATAGSRPASDGKRWISWPFIFTLQEPKDTAPIKYGGPLCVPRQWEFQEDGSITQRVPEELIRALHARTGGERAPLEGAQPLTGRWENKGDSACSLDPAGGFLMLTAVPHDCYFEADLTLDSPTMEAYVLLKLSDKLNSGYRLTLRQQEGLVELRCIDSSAPTLATVPVKLEARRPIKLRLFRCGTSLEVFIDDKAVLTHPIYQFAEGNLGLQFSDGTGSFGKIVVRKLGSP